MQTTPDDLSQCLRRFAAHRSEEDFRQLVEAWSGMVLSVARRKLNSNESQAAEVAQQVFTELARRAATLPPNIILGAWLHRVTCTRAALLVRTETRRRKYEAAAAMMSADAPPAETAAWSELAPVLDDELNRLPAGDRAALVLRFYEKRGIREVGEQLGTTEEGARKRITRALERLRTRFVRRGLAVPAIPLLGALLIQRSVEAATVPAGVIRTLTHCALQAGPLHWWARAWPAAAAALAGAAGVLAVAAIPLWQQGQRLPSSPAPAAATTAARESRALTSAIRPLPPASTVEEGLSLEQIVRRISVLLQAPPSDLGYVRLRALTAMITEHDASAALTLLAKEIPGVIATQDIFLEELDVLLSNAAETDPDGAMVWVKTHYTGGRRIGTILQLLGPLVEESELQAYLPELLSRDGAGNATRELCEFLCKRVQSLPFAEAAARLVKMAGEFDSDLPLSALMSRLSDSMKSGSLTEWETLWTAVAELPAPARRMTARQNLVESRAHSDPAGTRRWLDTLPAEERRLYASRAVFIPVEEEEGQPRGAAGDRTPEFEWLMRAAPENVPKWIGAWYRQAPEQTLTWLEAHPEQTAPALEKAGLLRSLSCIAMPEDAAAREEQTAAAAARLRPLVQLLKKHDPAACERLLEGIITVGQKEILERAARP